MQARLGHLFQKLAVSLALVAGLAGAGRAADMPPPRVDVPYAAPPSWSYRFASYGWLTAMQGTQTVRGRSVKVDASFIDIVEKSDSLMALMANFEARYGRFSLYTDFVWTKVGVEGGNLRARNPAPGIVGAIGTSLDVSIQMAIVEVGASYEVASIGPLAIDLLAGFRYWYQKADVSFDIAGVVDLANLELVGGRGIARSGSVNWLDPLIGARLRYAVAPGHEVFLRGDISAVSASAAGSPGRSSAPTASNSAPGTTSPSRGWSAIAHFRSTTPRASATGATSSTRSSTGRSSASARVFKPRRLRA